MEEVTKAAEAEVGLRGRQNALTAGVDPAEKRFRNLMDEAIDSGDEQERLELEGFRSDLSNYVKAYDFLSQTVPYGEEMESRAIYYRLLAKKLSEDHAGVTVDIADLVLTKYKIEIMDLINEIFADCGLTADDAVPQLEDLFRTAKKSSDLVAKAKSNTGDDFNSGYTVMAAILSMLLDMLDKNQTFVNALLKGRNTARCQELMALLGLREYLAADTPASVSGSSDSGEAEYDDVE